MNATVSRGLGVKRVIRSHVMRIAPGLLQLLDLYCVRTTGEDCITLLLTSPEMFRDILLEIYGSPHTLEVVIRLFLYPLLLETSSNEPVDILAKLFVNNPRELRELIREMMQTCSR
ncbi:MAG: hypothetical protein QXN82_03750 [Desulfurococcaceae archaeon]